MLFTFSILLNIHSQLPVSSTGIVVLLVYRILGAEGSTGCGDGAVSATAGRQLRDGRDTEEGNDNNNKKRRKKRLLFRESKPLPSSVAELPFFLVFFPAPTLALE